MSPHQRAAAPRSAASVPARLLPGLNGTPLLSAVPMLAASSCPGITGSAGCERTPSNTGEAPWPIERNLLTTGLVEAGVRSLAEGGRLLTPELGEVRYAVDDRQRWGGCYGEPAF